MSLYEEDKYVHGETEIPDSTLEFEELFPKVGIARKMTMPDVRLENQNNDDIGNFYFIDDWSGGLDLEPTYVGDLMEDEDVEAISIISKEIVKKFPDYTYIGIGGSPSIIIAFLKAKGREAYSLPFSQTDNATGITDLHLSNFREVFDHYLGDAKYASKFCIIDQTKSGSSLIQAVELIRLMKPDAIVHGCGISASSGEVGSNLRKAREDNTVPYIIRPQNLTTCPKEELQEFGWSGPVGRFISKLQQLNFKKFRAVGSFLPHLGDTLTEFQNSEDFLKDSTKDLGTRANYNELVLRFKGLGDRQYKTMDYDVDLLKENESHEALRRFHRIWGKRFKDMSLKEPFYSNVYYQKVIENFFNQNLELYFDLSLRKPIQKLIADFSRELFKAFKESFKTEVGRDLSEDEVNSNFGIASLKFLTDNNMNISQLKGEIELEDYFTSAFTSMESLKSRSMPWYQKMRRNIIRLKQRLFK